MPSFLRVKTVPHRPEEGATWLELFFDLIYVAILIEMGNRLSHDLSLRGVAEFVLLFAPIWLSWLEPVIYSRRFPTDDIGHRILTFLYMFLLGALAMEIHGVTGDTAQAFLLAYAGTKFVMALMYARAWSIYPEYRVLCRAYVVSYVIAGLLWVVIALFAPTNFVFWIIPTLLGFAAPFLIPRLHDLLKQPPVAKPALKIHYLLDRVGELTIIVLGEFFIKAVTSAADIEMSLATYVNAFLLIAISLAIWWLYFDHLDHTDMAEPGSKPRAWIDTHYLLLAALAMYGVAGSKVLLASPGYPLSDEKRLLLGLSLSAVVLASTLIEWFAREKPGAMARTPQIWPRVIAAALIAALAIWGGSLATVVLVLSLSLIMAVLVLLDVHQRRRTSTGDQLSSHLSVSSP